MKSQGSMRARRWLPALAVALAPALQGPAPSAEPTAEPFSWAFENFRSDPCVDGGMGGVSFLTWERYRETFIGIPEAPYNNNGFDYLWFKAAYEQAISGPGNCYGMVLQSALMNEKGGNLGFCAPVSQYAGDIAGTLNHTCNDLPPEDEKKGWQFFGPTDPQVRRAIEEMHGHQLNLSAVRFYLDQLAKGAPYDGNAAFQQAKAQVDQGKAFLVSIIKDQFQPFGGGHSILGYDAVDLGFEKRLYVYDPNRVFSKDGADHDWYADDLNYISIDAGGVWKFNMGGEDWSGSGGLINIIPIDLAGAKDRTPASMGVGAIGSLLSTILLSGSDASIEQVTDSRGKRLFQPGTKRIERNPALGMLNLVPIYSTDGPAGAAGSGEVYVLLNQDGGDLDVDVRGGGEGYDFRLASREGTVRVRGKGARMLTRLRLSDGGTWTPRLGIRGDSAGELDVEIFNDLRPGERSRTFRINALSLPPGGFVDLEVPGEGDSIGVVSLFEPVGFDLGIESQEKGRVQRKALAGLLLRAGEQGAFGPEDWKDLERGAIVSLVLPLLPGAIEGYLDRSGGVSSGPVGSAFDDARDLGGAQGGATTVDPRTEVYTQLSSGAGATRDGDSLQFAYAGIEGDFELTVEVLEHRGIDVAGAGPYGLMVRRDASALSRMSFLGYWNAGGNAGWSSWTYRRAHGTAEALDDRQRFNYAQDGTPRFMKLVRRGRTCHGFLSLDGRDWRPAGSDTWYDAKPGATVFAGFASASGEGAGAATTRFQVLGFGPIDPALDALLPDDGEPAGEAVHENRFNGRDAGMRLVRRSGGFTPQLAGGRLRLVDENSPGSATAAWSEYLLEGIDDSVWQFDFDLFFRRSAGAVPAEGVTFTLLGGEDLSRVGTEADGLGFEGVGREVDTDRNVSRPGFAVEFDAGAAAGENEGAGSPENPRAWHLGLDAPGQVNSLVQTSDGLPDPFSPAGVHVRIRYNRGRIVVWLGAAGGELKTALEGEVLPLNFRSAERRAVLGFTGATGRQTLTAEVDDLVVARLECSDAQEEARIVDAPESVSAGTVVTLDGSFSNAGAGDAEEPVSHLWEVLSGPASIDGPDDGPTVNLAIRGEGPVVVRLTVDDGQCGNPASSTVAFTAGAATGNWIRCDSNGDGSRDITDPIVLLSYLFSGGAEPRCVAALDCQSDGGIDITDAVFDLNFQFLGGPSPAAPYPACDSFPACGNNCR